MLFRSGILPDDVSRVPKLYKSFLPCRSSTNPHRRCPRVHSPVSLLSVYTTTFGAHRGAGCAWIHNSMGPIFINDDDGEFITATNQASWMHQRSSSTKVRGPTSTSTSYTADQIRKFFVNTDVRAPELTIREGLGRQSKSEAACCIGLPVLIGHAHGSRQVIKETKEREGGAIRWPASWSLHVHHA